MSESKRIQDLKARYNANGNAIIPNTFQHPNIFIDRLMHYLTPIENVVLTFAVRRILGFQDNIMSRRDNISLSQFVDGIFTEDGRALSLGCGVSEDAARKALEGLETYKVLLPTSDKPDPRKGQEYWLQDNENAIDWEGLEKRKAEKLEQERKRTSKARSPVGQESPVGQDSRVLSDRPLESCGTGTQNPQKPTETHYIARGARKAPKEPKPEKPKATDFPELVLFRDVVRHWPKEHQRDTVIDAIQKINTPLARPATIDDLAPFWKAWGTVSGNEWSLVWLVDWAVAGQIPNKNGVGYGQKTRQTNTSTGGKPSPEQDAANRAAAERILARRRASVPVVQ